MEWSEKDYEKIQQYLDGLIKEEDLNLFEQEMEVNTDLANEIAFHQEMEHYLADTPENFLRQNLQKLGNQYQETPSKPVSIYYWLLLLPIALIAGYFWMSQGAEKVVPSIKNESPQTNHQIDTQEIFLGTNKIDTISTSGNNEEEVKEPEEAQEKVLKKNKTTKPPKSQEKKKSAPKSPSGRPIADESTLNLQKLTPATPFVDKTQYASIDPRPDAASIQEHVLADARIPTFDSSLIEWNPEYPMATMVLSSPALVPRDVFEPYEALEAQITNNFKQSDLKIIVERQPADSIFLADYSEEVSEMVDNRLVLTLQTKRDLMKDNPKIWIYDNLKRVWGADIDFIKPYKTNGNTAFNLYRIDVKISLRQTPGLYYYALEGAETYFVGKYISVPEDPALDKLFAASFTPNEQLEFLMENNLRNSDISVKTVDAPQTLLKANNQDSALFSLSAQVNYSMELTSKQVNIHIFNNVPELYEDFNPIVSDTLLLQKAAADNLFNLEFQTPINAIGRYYYLIEDTVTERIYHVGRFEVKH